VSHLQIVTILKLMDSFHVRLLLMLAERNTLYRGTSSRLVVVILRIKLRMDI